MKQNLSPTQQFVGRLSPQAQVIYDWALWKGRNGSSATSKAVFRKDDKQLVVLEYGPNTCGMLTKRLRPPFHQRFREWSQPFNVVMQKLRASKWELVSSPEVGHAH